MWIILIIIIIISNINGSSFICICVYKIPVFFTNCSLLWSIYRGCEKTKCKIEKRDVTLFSTSDEICFTGRI